MAMSPEATTTGSLNVNTMFVSAGTPTAPLVGDVATRMGGAESRERIASKASTVPPETIRPDSWPLGWAESIRVWRIVDGDTEETDLSNAATPATCGAAIDVPLKVA